MGNPQWYERLDPRWNTRAESIEIQHGRPVLSDVECLAKAAIVNEQFRQHKFRRGEYFDRYLYKLLHQQDLSLDEYYWGCSLRNKDTTGVSAGE